MNSSTASTGKFILNGGIAGAVSTLVFTIIHHIWISDIWFSFIPMLIAGTLCGACLCWTYTSTVKARSMKTWASFNLAYTAIFFLLGALSVAMFEPRTTMAAVIAANEMPGELIGEAMPMTAAFTLLAAALPVLMFRSRWTNYGVSLVTCVLLVATLGLNVSAIGLVDIPGSAFYLLVELFGLIVALNVVFAAVLAGLQWNSLKQRSG